MRPTMLALSPAPALLAAVSAQVSNLHSGAITAAVKKSVDDLVCADGKRNDARGKVALVVTFAEVNPGQKGLELAPGTGCWTRSTP